MSWFGDSRNYSSIAMHMAMGDRFVRSLDDRRYKNAANPKECAKRRAKNKSARKQRRKNRKL